MALSSPHHAIDLEWMKEAYRLTRKDGAPGIDGVGAADYATDAAVAYVEAINDGVAQWPAALDNSPAHNRNVVDYSIADNRAIAGAPWTGYDALS